MSSAIRVRTQPEAAVSSSYDRDVYAWAREQAGLLRSERFDELDLANLAEEIEDVARAVRRQLKKRTRTLVEHLLKLESSDVAEPRRKWTETVRRTRLKVADLLSEAPSLLSELGFVLQEVHDDTAKLTAELLEDAGESSAAVLARLRSGGLTEDEVFGSWFPPGRA